MHLRTNLHHLRSKKVQVGDKHYDVDATGVVKDVDDEHAQSLLAHSGGVWHPHDDKTPDENTPGASVEAPSASTNKRSPLRVNLSGEATVPGKQADAPPPSTLAAAAETEQDEETTDVGGFKKHRRRK